MSEMQLAFDGREASLAQVNAPHRGLTPHQRAVYGLAKRPEGVTALQAGVAVHTLRRSLGTGSCGVGAKSYGKKPRSKGCCLYASSDGYAVLRRLAARGLVAQREDRGPYFAVVDG